VTAKHLVAKIMELGTSRTRIRVRAESVPSPPMAAVQDLQTLRPFALDDNPDVTLAELEPIMDFS